MRERERRERERERRERRERERRERVSSFVSEVASHPSSNSLGLASL
jgi:hypothetical protein